MSAAGRAIPPLPPPDLFGQQPAPILVLRSPRNWTVIGFLAALGLLQLTIWGIAVAHHHYEGYLSFAFGCIFVSVAIAAYFTRHEIAVLPHLRRIRISHGIRRVRIERSVPFRQVRGVRVTLTPDPDHLAGMVEIVCEDEAIPCPPTKVARQEALCLAITLGVRLIKVTDDEHPIQSVEPTRLDQTESSPS